MRVAPYRFPRPDMNRMAALVADLLSAGPKAVRAAKDLVAHVALKETDERLVRDTAQRIARQRAGAEAKEGLSAFLEKRKPGGAT